MKVNVIIPAHNESENIINTIDKVVGKFLALKINYRIIVVDDHSEDDTFEQTKNIEQNNIDVIRLSRPSGAHIAIRAGLNRSDGDCAIVMSADGQDNPDAIPDLVKQWQDGNHIVWALRKSRAKESLVYKILAKGFYWLLHKLSHTNIDLDRADFYLLDKKVVDCINACQESETSVFGIIAWIGFKQSYVEYDRLERKFGKSKWNIRSRFKLAFDWITAFSGLPLRLTTYFGFFAAFIGFLHAVIIFINALRGLPVEGWATMMLVILFLGGAQMITLGIIGEYLWRNIVESRKRPLYFIEKESKN